MKDAVKEFNKNAPQNDMGQLKETSWKDVFARNGMSLKDEIRKNTLKEAGKKV